MAAALSASRGNLFGDSIARQGRVTSSSKQRNCRKSAATAAQAKDDEKPAQQEQKEQTESKQSLLSSITDALDFSQVRSEKDADLIDDARQATKMGEKMSREQYAALRRKIGGTYKDFFKESVDVKGEYVETGWVDKTCKICGKDTSKEPRSKDRVGRYAHTECLQTKSSSGNFFSRLFGN